MVVELGEGGKPPGNRQWLFPTRQHGMDPARAQTHMHVSPVQVAFGWAREQSGTDPNATVHTLRHCYATHLLEAGVNIRQLRDYLGHKSIETTLIYTHLTALSEARTQATLQTLYQTLKG